MPNRSPRRAGFALAALVALGGALVAAWTLTRPAPEPPAPVTPARPAEPPDVPGPPQHAAPVQRASLPALEGALPVYRVGMQVLYDVALTSDTSFEASEAVPQRLSDVHVSLSGRWALTVVAADGEGVKLAATLARSQFAMEPENDEPKMAATRLALASRYYVSLSPRGTVQTTHFPKDIDPLARGLLKGLVAAWQVTLPSPPADAWQAEEQALEGDVLVAYGRLPGAGAPIEKRVVRYVSVAALGGAVPASQVGEYAITGRAEVSLDPAGWLAGREGQETLRVAPDGGLLTVRESRTSRLVQVQRREAPEAVADFERDWPRLDTGRLVDVQRLASDRAAIDKGWVAGASLSTLLSALKAAPGGDAGGQARANLVPRLAALLRLEPRRARDLETLARQQGDVQESQTLLAALSSAGTPEAQEALVALGGDPVVPRNERLRAVGLLGLAKNPTAESGAALSGWRASEDADLAQTATLALGNHVKRRLEQGGAQAPAETADLVQALLDALAAATTPEERALYLKALGNTGDPRAVPAIVAQLATDDVSVRTAALWALRFMPGAEVDALLVEALTKEPALACRQAVVAGAAFRDLAPLGAALDQVAKVYPDKALRLDVVQLLGVSKERYPPGIATLTYVAANDSSPEVREAAAQALKTGTVPGPKLEQVR